MLILKRLACLIWCTGFLIVCFIAKVAEFVEIEIEFEGADIF